jgi:hypothetical protein
VILLMLYHSLFLFLLPQVPYSSSTVTNMLNTWVCTWSCLVLCICFSLDLSSSYKWKHAACVFLILANFIQHDVLQLHPFYLQTTCPYSLWLSIIPITMNTQLTLCIYTSS